MKRNSSTEKTAMVIRRAARISVTEAGNLITYFALVGLTLAPAALGRRGFCRYLCPFGVWGIVAEKMRETECFMCETCVDVCPKEAIRLGFGRPR